MTALLVAHAAALNALGCRIRPETASDLEAVRQIYIGHRLAEFAPLPWSEAQKEALVAQQFELQRRQYAALHDTYAFFTVLEAEEAVGRLYLAQDGPSILILDFLLRADCRGRGLGTAALCDLIEAAAAKGCGVRLHVDKTNRCVLLYQRLGLRIVADAGVAWRMEIDAP
jgi:ribosomal protein S18 acetylase RimI-like enzyme